MTTETDTIIADVEAIADKVVGMIPGIPSIFVPLATRLLNLAIPFIILEIEKLFTNLLAKKGSPAPVPNTPAAAIVAQVVGAVGAVTRDPVTGLPIA